MFKRILPWTTLPIFLSVIAAVLLGSELVGKAVRGAMRLCAETLVPSLFPLAVLSAWMTLSGAAERIFYPWSILFSKFVRADPRSVSAVMLGLLCGYPIGALCLAEQHSKGAVSRSNAERLAACCTNAGPAFLVGVAGCQLLGSARAGYLLLFVQFTASLVTIFVFRPKNQNAPGVYHPQKENNLFSAFPKSVACAANSMLNITGFVTIASVLCAIVQYYTPNKPISALLCGTLEVTNGLRALSQLSYSLPVKFILFSALLGFSGICVHLQVGSAFLPNSIGMRDYFAGKMFHAGCATLISVPFSLLMANVPVTAMKMPCCFNFSIPPWVGSGFLFFSAVYTFLWKFRKARCIIDI